MNAAARLVQQHALSRHASFVLRISKKQFFLLFLLFVLAFSALAMIYVTHSSRIYYSLYLQEARENRGMQALKDQLLLEQTTLLEPMRIEGMAKKKLDMQEPEQHAIVYVSRGK